jgi:hypothetical protein
LLLARVVHQIMLVERGVHLIENLFLDELVHDKIYEFLFVPCHAQTQRRERLSRGTDRDHLGTIQGYRKALPMR